MDRAKMIFGNEISKKDYKAAVTAKKKFMRKFGDDTDVVYHLEAKENSVLTSAMGVKTLAIGGDGLNCLDEKSLIVGNIRMGFGHYRISMAIASAAHALGYTPYWFDLNSFDTAGGKIVEYQNKLYSMGSRLSHKIGIFNRFYWEPLNSEGFRRLSYNAKDQKSAELMTAIYKELPKDTPFVATHVWPAQAAIHAGMTQVVNAVPDNWQMGLHLAEGAVHTVQTPSAFFGYKTLRGMDGNRQLKPIPAGDIVCTGHYIDHELVLNIEADTAARIERVNRGMAKRYLLSVGGAGAQKDFFVSIIKALLPEVFAGKAVLLLNLGDHIKLWKQLCRAVPELNKAEVHFDSYGKSAQFANEALEGDISGIHAFCDSDIFSAVYITNLLMRASDVLITKPSELAFYPVPKLLIKRVGGHEAWGAIRSAEVGDGTYECETVEETVSMLSLMQNDPTVMTTMCECILKAYKAGVYNGAYEVVRLAAEKRSRQAE